MQDEALYIPHTLRIIIFNGSVYLYVVLSKVAELFMIGNLATVLLIANMYPLVKGIIFQQSTQSIFLTSFVFITAFSVPEEFDLSFIS